MPVSEAKKKANAKWDAEHRKTVGVCIPIELFEKFSSLCQENGTTKYAVLYQAVLDYIAANDAGDIFN